MKPHGEWDILSGLLGGHGVVARTDETQLVLFITSRLISSGF